MNRSSKLLVACLTTLFVAGCASVPKTATGAAALDKYHGALTDIQRLKPVPGQAGAYRWIAEDVDLGKYNKIELNRIQIKLDDSKEYKSIDPIALTTVVGYFRQSIEKALGNQYPLVDKSGPDVLRLHITLVDIVPNDPSLSGPMAVIGGPIAETMVSEMTGEPAGAAPYLGRTGVAVELIDSESGRIIGEYADTQFGRAYVLDTNKSVSSLVDANVEATENSFSKWSFTQQAFDLWANLLRTRLDKAHGQ